MANTLRFKRGLVAGIPTGVAGEPLFTTDTFDLYIGNGTTNTRFQKYIASGTTLQYLRGDGSLATFPTNIVTGTGVSGQVAYWSGTNTQVGSNNLFWDAANGRLGIGTATPQAMLDVAQGIRVNSAGIVTSSFANGLNMGTWDAIGYNAAGNTVVIGGYRASQWSAIGLYTANTLRATLDSSGNLGLGVTPSAWYTPSTSVLQIRHSSFYSQADGGNYYTFIGNNYFQDAGTFYKYINTGSAVQYRQFNGQHIWYNAPSGTAGNTITFTQAMTLTAAGRLILGAGDSGELLQVNGTMKVTGASTFGGETSIVTGGNAILNIDGLSTSTSGLIIKGSGVERGRISFSNSTTMRFFIGSGVTQYLEIDASTRAATFSSSVTAASLVVTGASTFGGNLGGANQRIANFRNSGGNGYIELQSSGAGAVALWTASGNEFAIYQNATAGTIGTNVFHITSTANVGISTFTPAYKLDVNGTFGATGAATFSSTLTTGGNILIGATASTVGALNFIKTGTSPVASRLTFGTDGTGYSFAIGKNQAGTVTDLFSILDSGAANFTTSIQAATAIAIGTTPDTNKPFKILKNINATVGINFENTSTSSLAFSAIQMGTDVTGGTKFTNLVYGSSGITQNGVYHPDGTSLINNGGGGLNFLGTPTRFYTGGSNGVVRLYLDNNGLTQLTATTPTTSETDGYRQYSADVVAGNAAPHFRTENGAVIKLYQETTAVGNSTISVGGGSAVLDDTQFGGYTLRQVVQALQNQGILA